MSDRNFTSQYHAKTWTGALEVDNEHRIEVGSDHRVKFYRGTLRLFCSAAPVWGQQITIISEEARIEIFFGTSLVYTYLFPPKLQELSE